MEIISCYWNGFKENRHNKQQNGKTELENEIKRWRSTQLVTCMCSLKLVRWIQTQNNWLLNVWPICKIYLGIILVKQAIHWPDTGITEIWKLCERKNLSMTAFCNLFKYQVI